MKKIILPVVLTGVLLMMSCNSDKKKTTDDTVEAVSVNDTHTSENALDWDGVYNATIPCADCEGIKTTITLNKDASYQIEEVYLGKNDSVFKSQGTFKWDANGQIITLSDADRNSFFVGENTLFQLDKSGNKITGDLADQYILRKSIVEFTDVKWKLVQLLGQDVDNDKAFISFASEGNRVFGNNSCNNFNGGFELKVGNQIALSKIATTMMACPDMTIEKQFMAVLEKADNYSLNGNRMTLNKARMAPLAVFELME